MKHNQNVFEDKTIGKYYSDFNDLFLSEIRLFNEIRQHYENKIIVDIGIGGGRTTEFLLQFASKYIGIDYSETMIKEAKVKFPDADLRYGDARNMSDIKGNSADFVLFSYNGIDCMSSNERIFILKECYRILKKDGVFAFSTHNLHFKYFDKLPWQKPIKFEWLYIKHCLKVLLYLPHIIKLKKHNKYFENYAIVLNDAHFYSLYLYTISPEFQIQQLNDIGFTNVSIIDKKGELVNYSNTIENDYLYYYCYK